MKHSNGQSLFAWLGQTVPPAFYNGLLAEPSEYFVHSGNAVPYCNWQPSIPFSTSRKGLCINLHLSRYEDDEYVAALACPAPPSCEGFLGIYLKHPSTGDRQYARVKLQTPCMPYMRQSILVPGPQDIYPQRNFQLRNDPAREDSYQLIDVICFCLSAEAPAPIFPSHARKWILAGMPFTFKIHQGSNRLAGALFQKRNNRERLLIMLGLTTDFGVAFEVAAISENESLKHLKTSFNSQNLGNTMSLENHRMRVPTESLVRSGVSIS